MSVLKLKPVLKDYIWGGTKLKTDFLKSTPLEKVAESWELSCHKDGPSLIENGNYKGRTLIDFIKSEGRNVLGTHCDKFSDFPVLIKLIDAKDNLSVQVHPDNEYALKTEGEYGKTEMWYIVDCDKGSGLLYGFEKDISKEDFRHHIENNTLLDVAKRVDVKKGDVFFIKSGTLHAIGKGIVIAEIQQNSNTTYRIYDYGRKDPDGNPRQLHIDKALEVTDLCKAQSTVKYETKISDGNRTTLLSECEYFTVYHIETETSVSLICDETSFNSILVLDGKGILESDTTFDIKKGDSFFITASSGKYIIKGKLDILLTKL